MNQDIVHAICTCLGRFPRAWNGRDAILQMRAEGSRNWKQTEWIGWYFEHLCSTLLDGLVETPGPKYGKCRFDGFATIPWDFKAHVEKSGRNAVPVNDAEAIMRAVEEHDEVGIIIARGRAEMDDDGEFRAWHQAISGGESAYSQAARARDARVRRRKVRYVVSSFDVIRIDTHAIRRLDGFQSGFRNSDGSPRRKKFQISLRDHHDLIVASA